MVPFLYLLFGVLEKHFWILQEQVLIFNIELQLNTMEH